MSRRHPKAHNKSQNNPTQGTISGTNSGQTPSELSLKEMRPRITAPVAALVSAFSQKHDIPVTAVINLAIVEFLKRNV